MAEIKKRKVHSAEFKGKVGLEAVRSIKTVNEIAQSHSFLSDHFWNNGYQSGKTICLDHGHNHSLYKLLALQALHGWWQYIVVFKVNPKPEDAKAYCEAGLIWCTEKTVQKLLASIDLCAHGVMFPFALHTTKYSVHVQPTPDDPDLTPEQLAASRRAAYEAVISAAIAAAAAAPACTF